MTPWRKIVVLDQAHRLRFFTCGDEWMDDWVQNRALRDHNSRSTKVKVALGASDHVCGLYSLSHQVVRRGDIHGGKGEINAVVIDRIAMSMRYQGAGYGTLLLLSALQEAVTVAESVPISVVVLEPLDNGVSAWYERLGFEFFRQDKGHMWMSMKDVKSTLRAAEEEASGDSGVQAGREADFEILLASDLGLDEAAR